MSEPAMTDAAVAQLLDDVFAYACERRVGDVIDVERILAAIDAVGTEPRLARFHARFVAPVIARTLERGRASRIPLARWLPGPIADALRAWLGKPVHVPRWVIDEIVTSEAVRDEVSDMLEEAMSDALRKGVVGGGVFSWGARAARGIVPEGLQRGVEDRMRDLLTGGVAIAQRRIARRLASPETARALGKRRRRLFRQLLDQTERDVVRAVSELEGFPRGLFAPIVAHNLARDEVRAALRAEIEAALAALAEQTIGELLDEYGLREWARAIVRERGAPLVQGFLAWRAARGSEEPR